MRSWAGALAAFYGGERFGAWNFGLGFGSQSWGLRVWDLSLGLRDVDG